MDEERFLRPVGDADAFDPTAPEDELEALLDAESDAEFGIPEFKDHGRVKLAEWSAQDFASIYVRFRPHLERHARRFLNNPGQVDEVVQDAFLYLMVSLPELDSELGVLRFLKWKTRLLCLDVIRASGRAYINNIDDHAELASDEPEISSGMEQLEDAAIVRMALAKLNPRHREVLIASMYEEKSTDEIAKQVGLNENATRQLIFRARAAFKVALLGNDVDTTGMSVSAILSVAARKAAQDARKVGSAALVLLLALFVAIGVLPTLAPSEQGDSGSIIAGGSTNPAPSPEGTRDTSGSGLAEGETSAPTPESNQAVDPSEPTQDAAGTTSSNDSTNTVTVAAKPSQNPASAPATSAAAADTEFEPVVIANPLSEAALAKIYEGDPTGISFVSASVKTSGDGKLESQQIEILDTLGTSVKLTYYPNGEIKIGNVVVTLQVKGINYTAYLTKVETWTIAEGSSTRIVFQGTLGLLFDQFGVLWDQSSLAKSTMKIELLVSEDFQKVQKTGFTIQSPE